MRWSNPSLLLATWAGLSAAHADTASTEHSAPKILGGRQFLSELKSRKSLAQDTSQFARVPAVEAHHRRSAKLQERQNTDDRCGAGRGSCASGYCCSAEGWCGLGAEYCSAPDCQINYGPGCDGNKKPSGADTSRIARPKLGNVEYGGVGIYDCVNKGEIALTFDDGPYSYTNDLLDKLAKANAKATFFITGNNLGKGAINDPNYPWRSTIQRMAAEGHQIASHTWSHENFTRLSTTQAENQMIYNEIAFNDILGYFPTYMRPPYSICERACQSMLARLGYHQIYFDLDTEGYLHDDANEIQRSKDIWDGAVVGSDPCQQSFLQIEHDIHYQTVYNLTDYILASLSSSGYKSVTVGQCLGDPPENWYRAGTGSVPAYNFPTPAPGCSSTPPTTPAPTLPVSTDGSCGATGTTCRGSAFGNCCSSHGWCGTSIDYCGSGCQSQFGTCSSPDNAPPADSPVPPANVSVDGSCGGETTCQGSEFGNCCSAHGWCGSTTDYCGSGCQSQFGTCGSSSGSGSGSAPPPTLKVSVDGSCGSGTTCQGSEFGNCCSSHGWCGSTTDYCGVGCQSAFGSGCQA